MLNRIHRHVLLALAVSAFPLCFPAVAGERPVADVEINTEVLRNYQPPQMFDDSPDAPVLSRPAPTAPPKKGASAEDLLGYPATGDSPYSLTEPEEAAPVQKATPPVAKQASAPTASPAPAAPQKTASHVRPPLPTHKPLRNAKAPPSTVAARPQAEKRKPVASVPATDTVSIQPIKVVTRDTTPPLPRPPKPQVRPKTFKAPDSVKTAAMSPLHNPAYAAHPMPAVPAGRVSKEVLPSDLPEIAPAAPDVQKTSDPDALADRAADAVLMKKMASLTPQEVEARLEQATPPAPVQAKAATKGPSPLVSPSSARLVTLPFQKGQTTLGDAGQKLLMATVLPRLEGKDASRVEIKAYASSVDAGQSSARRVSLSRALAVRAWLIEQGIEPNRMDLRALGESSEGTAPDRVDLVFVTK